MNKKYNVSTTGRTAQPRSKRLRELGVSGAVTVRSGGGSSSTVQTVTESSSNGDGHTHANKSLLDSLSLDDDLYLKSRQRNDETDESEDQKIKAGYADEAGHVEKAGYADEAGHAAEADHATEAEHAVTADKADKTAEAEHAAEADHAVNADTADYAKDADKWDGHEFSDYLDQPVRTTDDVRHRSLTAEELTATVKAVLQELQVKGDSVFGGQLSSEDFVSGFVGGKGWAIMKKVVQNALGVDETKWTAELDNLTVRGSLKVYEMIISQLLGENDNRIFTGMMEVDHYDPTTGRIWLDTQGGKLYNPFRKDDYIMVQQYGGTDSNVVKQYELLITAAGTGNTADGENRLDWVTFTNFSADGTAADLIANGDTLVRVDNASDSDRKGIVQINTVGTATPYIDIIYGLKTDPDNYLKGRLGNLAGIHHPLFGWLTGFGQYLANLYAVGDFRLRRTGESVDMKIEALKGLLSSQMQRITYNLTEEDNLLTNATFTESMEGWTATADDVKVVTVGGEPLMVNGSTLNSSTKMAVVEEHDGRQMLHLKNCGIRQSNGLITPPTSHKEYYTDDNGTEQEKTVADTLYLTLRMLPLSAGTLTIGFDGSKAEMPTTLPGGDYTVEVEKNSDWQTLKWNGTWDGKGDFLLQYTGEAWVSLLSVTYKPLDEYKKETSTKFTQTDDRISMVATKVDSVNGRTVELGLDIDAANEKISAHATRLTDTETAIAQLEVTADGLTSGVTSIEGDLETAKNRIEEVAAIADAASDAEVYNQANNPWNSWSSGTEHTHVGAIWHNTEDGHTYRYIGYNDTNDWEDVTNIDSTASYIQQNKDKITTVVAAFDTDGKPTEASGIVTKSNMTEIFAEKFNEDNTLKSKTGLMTTSDGAALEAKHFNDDGSLKNVAGLVTTSEGNKLYAKSEEVESYIKQTDSTLESVVKKGDVISSINQSEEEISIKADKINLNGAVTANENFQILDDGSVATKNITLKGALFQPFTYVDNSDAEAYRIADETYSKYIEEASGLSQSYIDANNAQYSEGDDNYLYGFRPYYTEEQIESGRIDPEDETSEALPWYAKWFTTTTKPTISIDNYAAIAYAMGNEHSKIYGIICAYKLKNQFQLDATGRVIVLPTDEKYLGCRVVLFNSYRPITRLDLCLQTVVITEDGGCILCTDSDDSYFAQKTLPSCVQFNYGTIELIRVKNYVPTENLKDVGTSVWMVISHNCSYINFTRKVESE
jgi:hypothetical protein